MRKYIYNSIQESKLIVSVCKKNMIPAFITSFLLGLASYLGALIAGRFIGVRALAAIALLAPFDGLTVITQNILITGSTSIYIRYKSQGKTKHANRAFGAILIFQAVFFCLFFLLLGLCSPSILHLFTGDEELIADALAYYYPIIIGEPLSMFCDSRRHLCGQWSDDTLRRSDPVFIDQCAILAISFLCIRPFTLFLTHEREMKRLK